MAAKRYNYSYTNPMTPTRGGLAIGVPSPRKGTLLHLLEAQITAEALKIDHTRIQPHSATDMLRLDQLSAKMNSPPSRCEMRQLPLRKLRGFNVG